LSKINPRILYSSVWEKPYPVRVTYVTLLLLREQDDIAYCDFDGLLRVANVNEIELKNALSILENIEVYSVDIAYSGKLIEKTAKGYKVLDVYNDNPTEKKEKHKHYMRQYRASLKAKKEGYKIPERGEQYSQKGKSTEIGTLTLKKGR
jgi:hypothetical protein